MNVLFVFTFVFIAATFEECFADLPSNIQKCKSEDVICIAKTATEILHNNPNGNKGLGLRKIEPIHLDELVIARTHGNAPLNLNLKFIDLNVFGLSKTDVTKAVGFGKDVTKSKYEIYGIIPELKLTGLYEANGRILLLPIVGNGTAEIILKNFKTGIKVKFAAKTDENGKQNLSIVKMKVQNDPEFMQIRLDNLFNGNKPLGDELNNVINTNWRDVWSELQSGINEGYKDIVKLLLNDVLKVISYEHFYSDSP